MQRQLIFVQKFKKKRPSIHNKGFSYYRIFVLLRNRLIMELSHGGGPLMQFNFVLQGSR